LGEYGERNVKEREEDPGWMFSKHEAEDLVKGGVHRLQALDVKEWHRVIQKIKEPQ
jgi:hypothetical protein